MALRKGAGTTKIDVVYPVYLDTPMLISFLATLDGGVSFSSEVAEKHAAVTKSIGESSGEVKLPGLASLLGLSLTASGKYARDKSRDQSTENKFVRQHTAASLFNRLYALLHQAESVRRVTNCEDLVNLEPGALVEVSGRIEASPLGMVVEVFESIWPFVELHLGVDESMSPSSDQSEVLDATSQRRDYEQTLKIVDLIKRDLLGSPVVDVILRRPDLAALVTASREYFSEDVNASLLGGTFTLIGKVTAVERDGDAEVATVRRGAMGIIAHNSIVPMLEKLREAWAEEGIDWKVPEATITGPHVQVIPLAIFV